MSASGTFSETKREVGLLRMLQGGVILSDYATLMVEILKDNARLRPSTAPWTCPGPSSWGRSRRPTPSKRCVGRFAAHGEAAGAQQGFAAIVVDSLRFLANRFQIATSATMQPRQSG